MKRFRVVGSSSSSSSSLSSLIVVSVMALLLVWKSSPSNSFALAWQLRAAASIRRSSSVATSTRFRASSSSWWRNPNRATTGPLFCSAAANSTTTAATVASTTTTASATTSNRDLDRQRAAAARGRRAARQEAAQQMTQRNWHVKQRRGNDNNLVAIKVSVDQALRQELKLSGREKRGRVFLEADGAATRSFQSFRGELHGFFRALRKDTYLLHAGFPKLQDIAANGTFITNATSRDDDDDEDDNNSNNNDMDQLLQDYWPVRNDDDVAQTFAAAQSFYRNHSHVLARPSLALFVQRHPDAPAYPPPLPAYLHNMPNPRDSPTTTMLSFYAFPPGGIPRPNDLAQELRRLWKPFQALGRVYVATEGVNAQMSVATNVVPHFRACCRDISALGEHMENGLNIDPVPLSRQEFATAGQGGNAPPFANLHIRVRSQILTDGLTTQGDDDDAQQPQQPQQPLDWQSAGYDMPPLEWHETLRERRRAASDDEDDKTLPIVLDCRNTYETEVGRFEGAEPLETDSFRDTWPALRKRLEDVPKDQPIMTYCTGGIRCVKVGAYLTQEMGFSNVSRLAGGIVAYDRELQKLQDTIQEQQGEGEEESMFKGTNFVFDGRLGRAITNDQMGTCMTCGAKTSLVSNCANGNCHKRMIQCENCRTSFHGTCSNACQHRVLQQKAAKEVTTPVLVDSSEVSPSPNAETSYDSLEAYSAGHSSPPPSVYAEMEINTRALIPSGSHMVSGATQGRFLTQLASMTREGRVLELGTFTGYATASLLEGAALVGEMSSSTPMASSRQAGPLVVSMERDAKAFDVAVAQLQAIAEHGFGEDAAEALCKLRGMAGSGPPAASANVVPLRTKDNHATCELWHVSDALAILEAMADGREVVVGEDEKLEENSIAPFDLVFVDADKTRLLDYADACLRSDRVLKKGGLIVVDNVLWKGLVLDASRGSWDGFDEEEQHDAGDREATALLRKNRRARKLANKMHSFNTEIVKDPRAKVLLLPVRDGLSIIRKK